MGKLSGSMEYMILVQVSTDYECQILLPFVPSGWKPESSVWMNWNEGSSLWDNVVILPVLEILQNTTYPKMKNLVNMTVTYRVYCCGGVGQFDYWCQMLQKKKFRIIKFLIWTKRKSSIV